MADTVAFLGIQIDSRDVKKAGLDLDKLTSKAMEAETATGNLTNGFREVKGALDPTFRATNQFRHGINTLNSEVKSGKLSSEQYARSLKQLEGRFDLLKAQADGTGKSFRGLRGAMGNLGFQFQDIAVQAQAGTNAMVIFTQQGSQIAGAFGPKGAVIGAVIAVAGAIGGALITSLTNASNAMKVFDDKIQSVRESLTSVRVDALNEQIAEQEKVVKKALASLNKYDTLLKLRPDLAKTLTGAIEANTDAIAKEAKEVGTAIEVLAKLREERQKLLEDPEKASAESSITRFIAALEKQVATQGKSRAEMLAYTASLLELSEPQQKLVDGLIKEVNAYEQQQIALKKAAAEKKAAQKQAIADANEFFNEVMRLRKENEKLNKSFQGIKDKLDPLGAKFRKVAADQKFLIDNQAALKISDDELEVLLEKLNTTLDTKGEDSGVTFAEAFMEGMGGIGDSLQDALLTGDWEGVGETIGSALSSATASVVEESIGGLTGSIAGSVAGGLVGALAGTAIGALSAAFADDFVDPTEGRQAGVGAGSTLGSLDEKADSLVTSNEIISDATSELVNINSDMLNALRGVEDSIKGFGTEIAKSDFAEISGIDSAVLRGRATQLGGPLGPSGPAFDENSITDQIAQQVLEDIGLGRLRVVDNGIKIIGGSLADIISAAAEGSLVEAYVDVQKRRTFDSDKFTTVTAGLGDKVNQQLQQVLEGVVDTVSAGAEALGIDGSAISDAIGSLILDATTLSLEGLSDEDRVTQFNAFFSDVFNDLALAVVPNLEDMRVAGEEIAETLARVATGFELSKEAVEVLGISFGSFFTTQQDLITASDQLVQKVGGIEAFSSALQEFEKNFLSVEDQLSNQGRRLTDALSEIGIALPATRQGFADLFTALDITNESSQDAIAGLLGLQSAADEYYTTLESTIEPVEDLTDSLDDLIRAAQEAVNIAASNSDNALRVLREAVKAEQDVIKTAYKEAVKQRKADLKDELISIKTGAKNRATAIKLAEKERLRANKLALDAAKDGLRAITNELKGISSALESLGEKAISVERRRLEAFGFLTSALASGNLTGTGEAAGAAANIQTANFGSAKDFRRQVGLTRTLLGELEESGEQQKTDAELAILRLEEQNQLIKDNADRALVANQANADSAILAAEERAEADLKLMEEQFEEEMGALDAILQNAIDQLAVLRGTYLATLDVASAVSAFGVALEAERTARQNLEALVEQQKAETEEATEVVSDVVSTPTPVDPTNPYGLNVTGFDLDPLQAGNIVGYADGGSHSGGLRLVGERGPELEVTGPSRIMNNGDLMSTLGNGEMVAELKQLRNDMNQVLLTIARDARNVSKRVDRWEGDGLPNFRDTQQVEVV